MSLWCGWVFDTVTTRRWCVVKGSRLPRAYFGGEDAEEILSSPLEVVLESQQVGAFSEIQDGLGPRVMYLLANPPKWVGGSVGEIYDEERLELLRKVDAEQAASRERTRGSHEN